MRDSSRWKKPIHELYHRHNTKPLHMAPEHRTQRWKMRATSLMHCALADDVCEAGPCKVQRQEATSWADLAKRPIFVLDLVVAYLGCQSVEPKLVCMFALHLVLEATVGLGGAILCLSLTLDARPNLAIGISSGTQLSSGDVAPAHCLDALVVDWAIVGAPSAPGVAALAQFADRP